MTDQKTKKKTQAKDEAEFLDYCSFSREEMIRLAEGSTEDREKATVPASSVTPDDCTKLEPMGFVEHLACILFLAIGPPNGALSVPLITFLIGKFVLGDVALAFKGLAVLLLPLVIIPQPFIPSRLHSWMAVQLVKYFSFRCISEERPIVMEQEHDGKGECRPQILVAPPHGVFPYGNLLAMLAWPSFCGHHFLGLAANAALRVPIFKQILRGMGVIDASRASARKALEAWPHTIGISTGGVAEVFETNAGDECILLKERIGVVKLAIRTGASIVPCYIYGNTKLLSCWAGDGIPYGRTILSKISRKIGFALIFFHGRFGLPIPRRIPLLSVIGKPIPTFQVQCEEPSMELISTIQDQLISDMQELFDKYKHLYGWDDKRLVIK